MYSFIAEASSGFKFGTLQLLQFMWLDNCFPDRKEGPPSEEAYRKACLKLPVEMVIKAAVESHRQARSAKDELYNGMRVMIVDGSRCIIPRTKETIEAYGLGSGTTGDAYYPQIHLEGFLDLVSGTFADMDFDSGAPRERQLMIKHAEKNTESTLYVSDAGFNGMAHVFMLGGTGHNMLMELKMGKLVDDFRKSRKRSAIIEVTLTREHLLNYPEHGHLAGTKFKVRLVRTIGTNKLRSRVLITTLLDEKLYKWLDLARLYLQRWRIELAFRHLKSQVRIEHIKKTSLLRIRQLLWAAIIFYNLAATIRNSLKRPKLFPEKEKIKIFCFSFILDMSKHFLSAAIFPQWGQKLHLQRCVKAMRNCWFLYEPWRIRPKICQFPSSVFTRCKSTQREEEFRRCEAVKEDMILLGIAYGMISPKREKIA